MSELEEIAKRTIRFRASSTGTYRDSKTYSFADFSLAVSLAQICGHCRATEQQGKCTCCGAPIKTHAQILAEGWP